MAIDKTKPTIIFDFDATIADTLDAIIEILYGFAGGFDIETVDKDELENKLKSLPLNEFLAELKFPKIFLPLVVTRIHSQLAKRIKEFGCFEGIPELLAKLHAEKFNLMILTTQRKSNVEEFLQHNKLNMFDFVYSEKNLFGKGRVLSNLIRKHGLDKAKAIYIGDETRDIDAAEEAGISVISVSWGINSREALVKYGAKHIADTPKELLTLIHKRFK